jgi:hypothetical protein
VAEVSTMGTDPASMTGAKRDTHASTRVRAAGAAPGACPVSGDGIVGRWWFGTGSFLGADSADR